MNLEKRGKGVNGCFKAAQLRDPDSPLKDHDEESHIGAEIHGQEWE